MLPQQPSHFRQPEKRNGFTEMRQMVRFHSNRIGTEIPTPKGGEIGIDMGIVRFATLSDGQFFEPINAFKTLKGKLAKLQKRFKYKTKFSKNWQKLKAKISKLHHKIANIRKNYLHQISSTISKNHAIVYIEDLQVANMSKSCIVTGKQIGRAHV